MSIPEQIKAFKAANPPFYIVELSDGRFSLCLPLDLLGNEYSGYCQAAFDEYAASVGDLVTDSLGLRTHGSGYEWEAAFREAFKDDPRIGRIRFDCEAGGFFCDSDDLSLIEEFGKRFRQICEDTERFLPLIAEGIRHAKERWAEQEKLEKTVKGCLMRNPNSAFEILTPEGSIRLTPENAKGLLSGQMKFVRIEGTICSAEELLDQEIEGSQTDLFNPNLVRIKTEESDQEIFHTFLD